MNTSIKQLSSGYEVEVRAVPPTAYLDYQLQFERDNPPPKRPMIKVPSVAGHTEELPALMNSPEYVEYDRATKLHEQELFAAFVSFSYNYAVVRWCKTDFMKTVVESLTSKGMKFEPDKVDDWKTQPPDTWQPDELYPDKTSPRRVLFIKIELIADGADERAISNPFAVSPLKEEEVSAALDKFRPDEELKAASGSPVKRKGRDK